MRFLSSIYKHLKSAGSGVFLILLAATPATASERASARASEESLFWLINISTDSSLNIRRQPSTAAQPIGQIPATNTLDIQNLGCLSLPSKSSYSWCEVRWNGIQGWASSDYLTATEPTPKPTAAIEETPTETRAEQPLSEKEILNLPDATIFRPSALSPRIEPRSFEKSGPTAQFSTSPVPTPASQERNLMEQEATAEYEERPKKQQPLPADSSEYGELEKLRQPLPPFMGKPFPAGTK